ncbi:MAG TPA: EAL domain-containing protein [Acidimicrobiia bacterium]|nr:EAL domain-containing protein [Acidimicrobiia bacterium]
MPAQASARHEWVRVTTTLVVPSILTGAAFALLSRFGLVGDLPLWTLLTLLAVAGVCGEVFVSSVRPDSSTLRLNGSIAMQTLAVTAIIYPIGWGPMLTIGYVFVFARLLQVGGSRVALPTLWWTAAFVLIGETAIALHLVPSYLNPAYAHGVAALGVLGVAFVVRLLGTKTEESERNLCERDRAERETRNSLSLLSATLDATADGILVVDREGVITTFNTRFAEMWRLARDVLDAGDDAAAIRVSLDQLRDPDAFVAKINELYAHPEAISDDTLLFKDGRVFERHSRPQSVGGEIVGRVWSFRDVTERQLLLDDLEHQAFHDHLTGLANRSLLKDRLDHALARSRRSGAVVSVLFCDLDRFKLINDTLGHDAGDALLIEVVDRFRSVIRDSDTAARMGGDEFAIVLDETTPHGAERLAERLLEVLRDPFTINGREVFMRASIGIADNEHDALDPDELLIRADIAMYAAKSRGRDRYERFAPLMQTELTLRHELHGDMRHAVSRQELRIHYQPLIDLATHRVEAVEALLRWQHPTRGIVSPLDFIPIAEETGLIIEIGRYVLQESCRQAMEWRSNLSEARHLRISVNVSAIQLASEGFVADVERALAMSGLPATSLILELTESTLVMNSAHIVNSLASLKTLGVEIAIDDFGTGYSSLAYLQSFPVDYLKIDRSFVMQITGNHNDENDVMVQSIINIGKNLNLGVVAEGIEERQQLEMLRAAGCHSGQGYLFAYPLPAEDVPAAIKQLSESSSASAH